MTATDHNAHFEELMAWLDGELPPEAAARVEAHVAACPDCRQMEAEMRGVSEQMARWDVPAAPATLGNPFSKHRSLSWSRWLPIAAALVIAVGGGVVWVGPLRESSRRLDAPRNAVASTPTDVPMSEAGKREANELQSAEAVQLLDQQAQQRTSPLLVRTAQLTLVLGNLDAARATMERIVREAGGFTGNINVEGGGGDARSLTATLRVPTARMDEAVAALKRLGRVTAESLNGEDVTQQSIDLDARLSNARASETRLKDILTNRTGKLSDVLDVEREISRVRGEIEQMEAERKSLDRRITYAVISIHILEERKAAVNLGPLPVSTQLRNAFVDGWTAAVTSALDATVFLVRTLPALLVWSLVLAPPLWILQRRFRRTLPRKA